MMQCLNDLHFETLTEKVKSVNWEKVKEESPSAPVLIGGILGGYWVYNRILKP